MPKPKCHDCEYPMKRVYHRVGSNGAPTAIKLWWYCQHCNSMEVEPYEISTQEEDYLHPEAAAKFPKIARVMEFNKDILKLKADLSERIERAKEFYKLRNMYEEEQKVLSLKRKWAVFGYGGLTRRDKTVPIWLCAKCGEKIRIVGDMEGVDANTIDIPVHCKENMGMTVIMDRDYRMYRYEKQVDQVVELTSTNIESASKVLLHLILDLLENFSYYESQKEILVLNRLNHIKNPDFVHTWSFMTIQNIFECFGQEINEHIDPQRGLVSLLFTEMRFSIFPGPYTEQKLAVVFDDIMLYLSRICPEQIPRYRRTFNKIMHRVSYEGIYKDLYGKGWNPLVQ